MKKMKLTTAILLIATVAFGQGVAINEDGAAPDPSAMLEVTSTEKGILIPRMTQAQREAISAPANGLLIFQTDETSGFYFNAGSTTDPDWQQLGEGSAGQWSLSGDNIYYMGGNVGIGEPSPQGQLHVSVPGEWAGIVFTGTGLNDLEVDISGYNGSGATHYALRIQNTGPTPNHIETSSDGGATWTPPFPIAPDIDMGLGVIINFGSTSGYTWNDRWDWTVNESIADILVVKDGNVGIGTTIPDAQLHTTGSVRFEGAGTPGEGKVLTSDASGNATWQDDVVTYQIGDFAHGGVVFYVEPCGTKGLVCAIEDWLGGSGIKWRGGSTDYNTMARGDEIYAGKMNTSIIIAVHSAKNDFDNHAALVCANYTGGGFGDWYLPSKEELNQMYINRTAINNTATANGGTEFASSFYWSSSEFSYESAWEQYFDTGGQGGFNKSHNNHVRAVRAF